MKRLHVHVGVEDLDASIRFYSALFGVGPAVLKSDYAKWMLDDPRVNFALSSAAGGRGVQHLGIQAESGAELDEVAARFQDARGPVLDEGRTTCCYATSDKSWTVDPDGVMWEAFFTDGEATTYGSGPGRGALTGEETPAVCCTPDPEAEIACCGRAA